MSIQTSTDDVFRYIHFGPAGAPPKGPRLRRTPNYEKLEQLPPEARRKVAEASLGHGSSNQVVDSVAKLTHGSTVDEALSAAMGEADSTVGAFLARLPDDLVEAGKLVHDAERLSDTLLFAAAAPHAAPPSLGTLSRLYAGYWTVAAVAEGTVEEDAPLRTTIAGPLPPDFLSLTGAVQSVGVADLLVVRQHIKRYESTEIAHVENIMAFETRSREHRQLERLEEIVTQETESETEKEEELETTERFELEDEASRTIKEDQKYSFDLTVSGQYGPVVEFGSDLGIDVERSEETKARNSTKYAKEVVQRSLDRVKERVRSERVRKIMRETEERNLHSFTNESDEGTSGIYQFLEKVYEAQVFNYGKRQMFDLMIPEPASYLWHLERNPDKAQPTLPRPPVPLDVTAAGLKYEEAEVDDPAHFLQLAKTYGATGLEIPPPNFKSAMAKHVQPVGLEGGGAASEAGDASAPPIALEVKIPAGYIPTQARVSVLALTNDIDGLHVAVSIPNQHRVIDGTDRTHVGGNPTEGQLYFAHGHETLTFSFTNPSEFEAESNVAVSVLPFQTANHSVVLEVEFERLPGALHAWKLRTHETIAAAYRARVLEHKDELARVMAEIRQAAEEEEREVGLPPTRRRQIILTELKKHCIAILRQRWFTDSSPMVDNGDDPPTFRFEDARIQGTLIRFLEHAFEWNQLQYAFYPYFWAADWDARFRKDDPDYEFQQFLQAGSARVVFSVRPGFERAVSYFLERGVPFEGRGEPTITDPLYLSIVDEIRERGAVDGAIPIGDPWEVRMPTSLILLRESEGLPTWQRVPDSDWEWEPIE